MISRIRQNKIKQILKYLQNTHPDKFEAIGKKKLYKALKNATRISPAYRNLLSEENVDLQEIKTFTDFQDRIPITNKKNYFEKYTYEELLGKNTNKMKYAMSSSGYTGTFAYGFSSDRILSKARLGVDATFEYWFDISNRKTFLINCAPMGVHVDTSLPVAETSVRSDMAIALLKKVSPGFEQTIIGGDPYFLKKLIEEGDEKGIDWRKLKVSIITAQDWLPESLRSYMAYRIGIDPDNFGERGIYATMGMTELGLNVFHESKYTVAIRREILKDMKFRTLFPHTERQAPPCVFHYYPFRTFIESISKENQQELIFTVTDLQNILPVIRYSSGDSGNIMPYSQLKSIIASKYLSFLPDLKLPLGILYGRTKNKLILENQSVFIEDLKEGLFADHEVASKVTGLIKVEHKKENLHVLVHLKKGIQYSKNLERNIHDAIHKYISIEVAVRILCYHEFPGAVELNYEKKLGS